MAAKIEKTTIIGDVLDIAPRDCSAVHGHRHALPGLPVFPRRDRRRSLHGARR